MVNASLVPAKNALAGQRGLMMATVALIQFTRVEATIVGMAAFGAKESVGPAPIEQRFGAFILGSVFFEENRKAQSFLKLYGVLLHDHIPLFWIQFHCALPTGSIAEPH